MDDPPLFTAQSCHLKSTSPWGCYSSATPEYSTGPAGERLRCCTGRSFRVLDGRRNDARVINSVAGEILKRHKNKPTKLGVQIAKSGISRHRAVVKSKPTTMRRSQGGLSDERSSEPREAGETPRDRRRSFVSHLVIERLGESRRPAAP
ncbi:hypothetical protein SKAU_G00092240 [Synaphobranchus kaupii]|uniref:Uncharacterized protein n=1 Tax=Synaphobranchus kaupii TaxID=118154 RepID=A0A9Q1J6K0_SYNKA|nr:hypothetical protein SKAU_G00092240 [Synaphobranchus kaupii]